MVKSSLTDEEFEEIVKSVLQKSSQKYLGGLESSLDFAENTCTQSIECAQLDKEPDKEPSTDNGGADREQVVIPHSLETSTSQEAIMIPEVKASAQEQPDPTPSEKKFDRLLLSKRKKNTQNDKMEKAQSGYEKNHKDQPKKIVQPQPHCQIRNQEEGEESGFGQCLVWVQCSSASCKKWRRLHRDIDPASLPENWSCDQNTDLQYNCCTVPEEIWTGGESEVAYASYIPGSIIWAKQYGHPWWPGMVESDPDLGEYFLFSSHLDSLPSKYHVTFFGEKVSRAWIPVNMLKNFQELSCELSGVKKYKNKDYSQKLRTALTMAQEAEKIGVQERINTFGFWSRYNGYDSNEEKGNNSPNSSPENEEETSEEEEVKEKKKDKTLLSHKADKNKTRKLKARDDTGSAHGRDGALQKKVMKRCLGSEPAAPAPKAAKKEQARSDPDQPRTKKKFNTPQSKDSQTYLFMEKEARIVLKALIPPVHCGAYSMVEPEGSGSQEPLPQKDDSVPCDDEVSRNLDLEQLMEEPGKEPEKEELQPSDSADECTTAVFEE